MASGRVFESLRAVFRNLSAWLGGVIKCALVP